MLPAHTCFKMSSRVSATATLALRHLFAVLFKAADLGAEPLRESADPHPSAAVNNIYGQLEPDFWLFLFFFVTRAHKPNPDFFLWLYM